MKKIFLFSIFIILTLQEFSISQSKAVEYLDPVPGANYVCKSINIIIKPFSSPNKNIVGNTDLITVKGTKSGIHTGRIILSADGKTVIFKLEKEFEYSEKVFVKISSNLTKTSALDYYFTIKSREANPNIKSSLEMETGVDFSKKKNILPGIEYTIDSLPSDFPHINIDVATAPSYGSIFLSIINSFYYTTPYLMILDNTGYPVFYRRMYNNTTDFKMQPNGNLTYFEYNKNKFYELDKQYRLIDSFYTGNNYVTDAHDLRILNDGSSYLMSYDPEIVNMSLIIQGGDTAAIVQGLIIQRIDSNKNVIFQWRSWDHFQITDATHENLLAHSIDYVHGNAIEADNDGNILLSSRHLDEITKINSSTGAVIWRLGGKNNQFTFINDPYRFSHQHTVRRIQNGNITIFDNGNYHSPSFSRAVEYHVDETNKTATLVWQFRKTPDIYSSFMGNVQRLDNGNTIIGWGGTNPSVTEVNNSGSVVFQLNLPTNIFSYRAYRFDWSPSAAVLISPPNNSSYVSTTPKLEWFAVPHASGHRVQISKNTDFTELSFDTTGAFSTMIYVPNGKLNMNTEYFWRVYSDFGSGSGTWSDVWEFTTATGNPPIQVELCTPADSSVNIPKRVVFKWYKINDNILNINKKTNKPGLKPDMSSLNGNTYNNKYENGDSKSISSYCFELSTDSTFKTTFLIDSTITDTLKEITELNNLTKYFWRVKAKNESGWGDFSSIWNFTTIINQPLVPELFSPINNSSGIGITPLLDWREVPLASYYGLQISTDSLFTTLIYNNFQVMNHQLTIPSGKLNYLSKYYWRVNASNAGGTSPWSNIWSFTTSQGLPLTLKFYLEGFWNGTNETPDTVNVYLANAFYPYSFSDSINNILFSPEGTLNTIFTKAANGNYYIVIKHRNHLETWSADTISFVTGVPVIYDFTTSADKAYGNNMKQVNNVWVLLGGDPNQDGSIDADDIPVFILQYGLQGYLSCDFNGDGDVNAVDVQIIASNFGLTKSTPLLSDKLIGRKRNDKSK